MTSSTDERTDLRRRLFVSAVVELFDKGFDTWQISKTLKEDQAGIERALHEGLEERRRKKSNA